MTNDKYERAALQDLGELAAFIEFLKGEKITSYLEIGSKFGGSLWKIAKSMPVGSRIVSVDLPFGDTSFKESQPHLEACIARLNSEGYDAHLFLADSTDPNVVRRVAALSPFDACLIDANHTEPYVRKDWANYGPLCKIVCFHDISWVEGRHPPSKKYPIQVKKVWDELKENYHHKEIRLCHTGEDNGIGILFRSHESAVGAAS